MELSNLFNSSGISKSKLSRRFFKSNLLLIFDLFGLKFKNKNKIKETTTEEISKYRYVLLIIQTNNNIFIFIRNRIKINRIKRIII